MYTRVRLHVHMRILVCVHTRVHMSVPAHGCICMCISCILCTYMDMHRLWNNRDKSFCESTHGCLTMAQIISRKSMVNKSQRRTNNPCPSDSMPHVVVTLHMLSFGLCDPDSFPHELLVLVTFFCPAHGYLHIRHGFFNTWSGHSPHVVVWFV